MTKLLNSTLASFLYSILTLSLRRSLGPDNHFYRRNASQRKIANIEETRFRESKTREMVVLGSQMRGLEVIVVTQLPSVFQNAYYRNKNTGTNQEYN